jgi:hypothetical protein
MPGFGKMGARGGFGSLGLLGRAGTPAVFAPTPLDLSAMSAPALASLEMMHSAVRPTNVANGTPVLDIAGTPVNYASNMIPGATSGNVSKWYDVSPKGNNYHSTQATDGNRPQCDPTTGKEGGILGVTCDGTNDGTTYLGGTKISSLDFHASLALNQQSMSVFMVVQNTRSNSLSVLCSFYDGVSNDSVNFRALQGLSVFYNNATNRIHNVYPPAMPAILGFTADATNTTLYQAGRSSAQAAPPTANTTAGGRLAKANAATTNGNFRVWAILAFSTKLSTADVAALRAALKASYAFLSETWRIFVWEDGDSINAGTDAIKCQSLVTKLPSEIPESILAVNAAGFGLTSASIVASGTGRYSIAGAGWTLTGAPTKKIIHDNSVTNDISTRGVVTGVADNGSGLIRVTLTSNTSQVFGTGRFIRITGVLGATQANGDWTMTKVSATQFDLQGSSSAGLGTYTSGGTINTTEAQLIADKTTAITNAASLSYGYLVETCLPRASFSVTEEAIRVAFNAWVTGGGAITAGAGAVANTAGDSRLSDPTNTTYYFDQLHPTDLGQAVRKTIVGAALRTMI